MAILKTIKAGFHLGGFWGENPPIQQFPPENNRVFLPENNRVLERISLDKICF